MIINPITFGGGGDGSLRPYAERSGTMVLNDPDISYVAESAFNGSYGWSSILTEVELINCSAFYNYAFAGCESLSRVYAPNCVTYDYVANPAFPSVRTSINGVFSSCNNLVDITLGFSSVPSNFYGNYFRYYNPDNVCSLYLPNCVSIGSNAFMNAQFTNFYASNCTYIDTGAFRNAYITSAYFPSCSYIGSEAFVNCRTTEVYLPLISNIPNRCFAGCRLSSFVASDITYVGSEAFTRCMNFSSIDLTHCSYIGSSAFSNTALSILSAPLISEVEVGAFNQCAALRSVDLPNCTNIKDNGFRSCIVLGWFDENVSGSLSFPQVQFVGSTAFANCNNLSSISFPMLSSIYSGAFNSCYKLISLYLMGSSVCRLQNSSCFVSTPIGGYSTSAGRYGSIYVPASLLSSYKTATHWSRLSSRFVGV